MRRYSLARKIHDRYAGRREQQIGNQIREHPVNELWHAAVERPQAGFNVRHWHEKLRRRERTSESRVGVAVDEHNIGVLP